MFPPPKQKKSKAKDTGEGSKTKNNHDICRTPNTPEERREEIINKGKGKGLETDGTKAVEGEEKEGGG